MKGNGGGALRLEDSICLGSLFVQLLTGKEPFLKVDELVETGERQEAKILKYALPGCVTMFSRDLPQDPRCAIIASMLDRDASKRPTMKEVVQALASSKRVKIAPVARFGKSRPKQRNTVLFPARMGLPHRGHIEYMTRVMELGFHLKIAIQRTYTSTQDDPYPKWIVAKMVAQSLFDRGFCENDFTIVLTPYFMTDVEVRIYYALMPGREDIIGVASDNPTVWEQFKTLPIYSQQAVFGIQGKRFKTRSWGSFLRTSIRTNNRKVFAELSASGVTKIRSFEELVLEDNILPIEFLHGHVFVELEGAMSLAPSAVHRFDEPERVLLRRLQEGRDVCVLDRWSRQTCLTINGLAYTLVYADSRLRGDNLIIRYQLEEQTQPT